MHFLDPYNRFSSLEGAFGRLHYFGATDISWPQLLSDLESHRSFAKRRGNFAFVYLPHNLNHSPVPMTAAVDHVASMPLFLSQRFITYHFGSILQREKSDPETQFDRAFFWEHNLFWGYNVSQRTLLKSIQRIRPGHYFQNGSQSRFIDLTLEMSDSPLSLDEFRATLESCVTSAMGSANALLVSGGTDSATLMALVAHLDLKHRFRIVSVRSDNEVQSEQPLIEKLAKKLGLTVNYFSTPTLKIRRDRPWSESPSEMVYWKDYSFLYRKMAVASVDHGDLSVAMTGECGDQLFGGPKLSKHIPFILQARQWTPHDIARQYIHLCMREASPEWQGYKKSPLCEWYSTVDPDRGLFRDVYEETVETIARLFSEMPTDDIVNRLLNLNLVLKGPYRVFHYSQDSYRFFHPFAQWEMVRLALRTRSRDKIYNNGRLKEAFFQAYKDRLIHEIWEAPKIGTAIPFH